MKRGPTVEASFAEEQPAQIVALHEDVRPDEYLLVDATCLIGRAAGCHIIVGQREVSRLHARIERAGPRYTLSDAGSANGTYINGHRIGGPHLLEHDDLIGLGSASPLLR